MRWTVRGSASDRTRGVSGACGVHRGSGRRLQLCASGRHGPRAEGGSRSGRRRRARPGRLGLGGCHLLRRVGLRASVHGVQVVHRVAEAEETCYSDRDWSRTRTHEAGNKPEMQSRPKENTSNRSRREFLVPREAQIYRLDEAVSACVSGQGCSCGF